MKAQDALALLVTAEGAAPEHGRFEMRIYRNTCSIPDCGRLVVGRGWCPTHYNRWKRHGDPNYVRPERPAPPRRLTQLEKFWSRINQNGPIPPHLPTLGPCWVWTRGTASAGYGRMRWRGGYEYAHRIMWILANDAIPDGLWILHKCDNPLCCRPEHLFLGTPLDNVIDRNAKGRHPWAVKKYA